MTTEEDLADGLELIRLADESEALTARAARRAAYENVLAQHESLKNGADPDAYARVCAELAEYTSGGRPIPRAVPSAALISFHRRQIAALTRLAAGGVEGAAEGLAEAETALAEELARHAGTSAATPDHRPTVER
ncbi:hypothetical protein [Streptomyces jumonjinensis]|uniref:hypothetical protein n=1 Tax=Streptomyces jumonjinensis TaxID=1945 RepID=UPI0037B92E6F